jgi:hypothetical protein
VLPARYLLLFGSQASIIRQLGDYQSAGFSNGFSFLPAMSAVGQVGPTHYKSKLNYNLNHDYHLVTLPAFLNSIRVHWLTFDLGTCVLTDVVHKMVSPASLAKMAFISAFLHSHEYWSVTTMAKE